MVYYFKSTAVDPPAFIYVGKDKVESMWQTCLGISKATSDIGLADEDLIKFGWDEDVW